MREIISAIEEKQKGLGGCFLHPPASRKDIEAFESNIGFRLPSDFIEFYSICNGFECTEDIFKIVSLQDALQYSRDRGINWFHFSEYMIYSDMWSLQQRTDNEYVIVNKGVVDLILTSSLKDFLRRFLQGGVFEKGGLYDWHDELKLT